MAKWSGKQQLKLSHHGVNPGVLEIHHMPENKGAMIQVSSVETWRGTHVHLTCDSRSMPVPWRLGGARMCT